jgi:hypothetical protein
MIFVRRMPMRLILRSYLAALLFAIAAPASSLDPAFANIPFDRWVEEGNSAHLRWTAKILPVELSNHQRLQAKVAVVLDGNELAQRRGKGFMVMLMQFKDSENHVYQTHEAIDLGQVKDDAGRSNIEYTPAAFVTPGDYQVSLAIFDTETNEHSGMRLPLRVAPLKHDPLPDSWNGLPAVEIPKIVDAPDGLYLPDIASHLSLQFATHRPVRVEVLVNASPVSGDQNSGRRNVNNRSLVSLIPAMKIIAHTGVPNGVLDLELLDLTTQQVIYRQDAVHQLDWEKLGSALKQAGPNVIDVHSLEKRKEDAQFFLKEVRKRIGADERNPPPNQPRPILIVLSGPMAFGAGEDLHPIELGSRPDAEVFYIRYHSFAPREPMNPYAGARRGRRMPMADPGRNMPGREPIDSLEQTLKPLEPHLYDVTTPEQFRKALSDLIGEISRN